MTHRLAVSKAPVFGNQFERMCRRMSEIQNATRALIIARDLLAFIGGHNRRLKTALCPDDGSQKILVVGITESFAGLIEEFPAGDRALLYAFAPAGGKFSLRYRFQRAGVNQ